VTLSLGPVAPLDSWGKHRRLARLRTAEGTYLWLALDHGLTHGTVNGLKDMSVPLTLASSPGVTGVVVNRGSVASVSAQASAGLVLQTFGLPALGDRRDAKVPVCRVDDAVRLSADAVAVQLDVNAAGLPGAVRALSATVSDAAGCGMPVLAMVTAAATGSPYSAISDVLHICTELGADLIKVALPDAVTSADEDELDIVRGALLAAPPTLVAGGDRSEGFATRLGIARDLGFSGTCIGRNVFQAPDPAAVLGSISAAFMGAE
jgi:class I fructose-bisphosphate aldolase